MTPCPYSERLLALFCDGELEGLPRRGVAAHVVDCVICTRTLASIEHIQELVHQSLEEEVEKINFSNFFDGVISKLDTQLPPVPPWRIYLQFWRERWRRQWAPGLPAWAAAAVLLLLTTVLLSRLSLFQDGAPVSPESEYLELAMGNQAQIESLSASATVFLWNEPTSNATVIWVGDDEGGVP